MKRSLKSFPVFIIVLLFLTIVVQGQSYQSFNKKVLSHNQTIGDEQVILNKGGMQITDYGSPSFNNPNYYYTAVKTAPDNIYYKQAGLSPDGTKIVAAKQYTDGAITRREVVLMNADGTGETIISPGNSGVGDIYQYGNPFWSDDGLVIGFVEVHNAAPNKLIVYTLSSGTSSYLYEPDPLGELSINNPDFLGSSKTTVVFWDNPPQATGESDLYTWDSNTSTLTNITMSHGYKEYEPVSNAAGDKILYWSGETVAEPTNTTHTLTNVGGIWTKDVGFTAIADSYWGYFANRSEDYIAVTTGLVYSGANQVGVSDVKLYNSSGTFVQDLTGSAYSGGSGQWIFTGSGFEGPQGEMLLTSNAGRTTAGRDIIVARPFNPNPAHGTTSISVTPTISWNNYMGYSNSAEGTYSFELYLNTAPTLVYSKSGIDPSVPHTLPGSLLYNTSYQWFIKGSTETTWHGMSGGNWGQGYSFTTLLPPPSAPTALAATNIQKRQFTANWTAVAGAVSYSLDVSWDNFAHTFPAYTNLSLPGFSHVVSNMYAGSTFQYRVRAFNGSNYSTYSNVISVTTPPATTLISPATGQTGISILPRFSWDDCSDETAYTVLISTDGTESAFFDSVKCGVGLESNITSYQILETNDTRLPLKNGTDYYWRIIVNDNTSSSFGLSQIRHFTTYADFNIYIANPLDGTTITPNGAIFSWYTGQSTVGQKFVLQYRIDTETPNAHDWADVSTTYTSAPQSGLMKYVNNLVGGKTYYWRVIAQKTDGEVIKYSDASSFTTTGGASVACYPSWPGGGATVYTNSPTLWWYIDQYATGLKFQVQYNTDGSETAGILNSAVQLPVDVDIISQGSGNLSKILHDLGYGSHIYWQVRAYYSATGEWTNWSAIENFEIYNSPANVAPVSYLSYPVSGVAIYTTAPYFYWYTGTSTVGLKFDIQVNDGSDDFSGVNEFHAEDLTTTNKQFTDLLPGHTYYWRVNSHSTGSTSDWSETGSFTVVGGIENSYPVATSPILNSIEYTTKPTLYWYLEGSSLGLTGYYVKYKIDSEPADWTADLGSPSASQGQAEVHPMWKIYYQIPTDLTYGGHYYWAVYAYNGSSETAIATGEFTVVGGENNNSILQWMPADGSTVFTSSTTFSWSLLGSSVGIDHYVITYSSSDVFDRLVTWTETSSSTFKLISGLQGGTTYFWKVQAFYSSDESSPATPAMADGDAFQFFVEPGSPSVVVQPLVGGPNNLTINTSSPVLSWVVPFNTTANKQYEVQLAEDSEFKSIAKTITTSSQSVQTKGLTAGSKYFWRVRAKDNSNNYSYFSGVGKFGINSSITAVEQETIIPTQFELHQNYPNPFNPTTKIFYSLPLNSLVSIKIYDMLGRELKTLVNQAMNAGVHSVDWNADNENGNKVTSGVYIYRITAGNFIATKKMIFIK